MRTFLWGIFLLVMAAWSGLAWVTAELAGWSAQALASEPAGSRLLALAELPLPAWLGLWVGPELLDATAATARWLLQVSAAVLPAAGTATGWLVPLVWIVWGLGAFVALAVTVAAHLALSLWRRRADASPPALPRIPA